MSKLELYDSLALKTSSNGGRLELFTYKNFDYENGKKIMSSLFRSNILWTEKTM